MQDYFSWIGPIVSRPKDVLDPHFTFLYQSLKDTYGDYSYYIFTTTSAILLMIGWLLTSKDARAFLSEHAVIKKWAITVVIICFVCAEWRLSYDLRTDSQNTAKLIQTVIKHSGDNLLVEGYFQPRVIGEVPIFIAAHVLLYLILISIVWSIPKDVKLEHKSKGTTFE